MEEAARPWMILMEMKKHVPIDWDNLPSIVMVPVPWKFSCRDLITTVSMRAPEKQLVGFIGLEWTTTHEEAFRAIQDLYEFADDPKLVLLRYIAPIPGQEKVVIRASFLREVSHEINSDNLFGMTEEISKIARTKGLHTMTLE